MNNSKLAIDNYSLEEEEVDIKPMLRAKESELGTIIESLKSIAETKEWSSLKNLVFDGVVETLERQQKVEASKENPDLQQLARINGQLIWARKYSDLNGLMNFYRNELKNVREKIHGKIS